MVIQNKCLRSGSLFFLILAPLSFMAHITYRQVYKKGLQAEVFIVSRYLHTLQTSYYAERGEFIGFSYYGASLKGQDYCMQPEGAAELGFVIAGCHELRASPPRYTFQLLEASDKDGKYTVEAISGSDRLGRSFVCFEPDGHELWVSWKNQEPMLVESCG